MNTYELAKAIQKTFKISYTEAASRTMFNVEEIGANPLNITTDECAAIVRYIEADIKAGK